MNKSLSEVLRNVTKFKGDLAPQLKSEAERLNDPEFTKVIDQLITQMESKIDTWEDGYNMISMNMSSILKRSDITACIIHTVNYSEDINLLSVVGRLVQEARDIDYILELNLKRIKYKIHTLTK